MRPDRGSVWRHLGAPTEQLGSVNEPRTRVDYGRIWNEKWIYRSRDGSGIERVVLWHRYDLVGVFRLAPDGAVGAEALPESWGSA